jgi:hypothetical protein
MSLVVEQGDTVTITPTWVLGANGDAPPTVDVKTLAGASLAGFPTAVGLGHPGVGLYNYPWAVGGAQAVGGYEVVFLCAIGGVPKVDVSRVDVVSVPSTFLCALADVRALAHVDDPTNTDDDATLTDLMGAATDLIHTLTGRYFLPDGGATYTFDGQWNNPWALPIPRGIRTVTTLKVRTGGTGSALSAALGVTEFCIRPLVQDRAPGEPGFRIELTELASSYFALIGSEVIEVVGDFGYAAVPPTVERICRETVLRAFRRRGSGLGESLSGPGTPASYISWAMTLEDKRLLEEVYSPVKVR